MTKILFFDKIIMRIEGFVMKKEIKITYNGSSERSVSLGTTYKEISEHYKNDFQYDIVIAKVNNSIVELGDTVTKNCNIEFFDRSSSLGNTDRKSVV